jgi:hypothetical protein
MIITPISIFPRRGGRSFGAQFLTAKSIFAGAQPERKIEKEF